MTDSAADSTSHARREELKHRYGFDDWPGRGQDRDVRGFLPEVARLEGYALERRLPVPGTRFKFMDRFAAAGGAQIAVRVSEYPTGAEAHDGLIDLLQLTMAPELLSCSERGLEIGDVCFCGLAEPTGTIFFGRANLVLWIESVGDQPSSVVELATALDGQIVDFMEDRGRPGDPAQG